MITRIEDFQADIDQLKNKQQALVVRVLANTELYTLDQRFDVWSKYAIKIEEPYVIHANKYPIIGGMVDDCYPCDYNKYQRYDWEFFLETANDNFEESQDPELCSSEYYEPRFTTQASIDALKEEMIILNFGSFEMDW